MIGKIKFDNKIYMTQYQIIKRNLQVNTALCHYKAGIQAQCTFGCNEYETVEHLFYKCAIAKSLIREVNRFMPKWTKGKPIMTIKDLLFMDSMKRLDEREALKLILKYFIWKNRCSNSKESTSLTDFKKYLYDFMKPHQIAQSMNFLKQTTLWEELLEQD